jgi:hypothetical protein
LFTGGYALFYAASEKLEDTIAGCLETGANDYVQTLGTLREM